MYGRQETIFLMLKTSKVCMKPHSFSSSTEEKQLYQPPRVVVRIKQCNIILLYKFYIYIYVIANNFECFLCTRQCSKHKN